jgi:hypothetical protein
MNQAYLAASHEMAGLKGAPNEPLQNRAYVISNELGQALKKMAKGTTPKAEAQTRRERSPSVEMVESGARTTGKSKEEGKQQKRAREERTSTREERGSAQVAAKRTLVLPRPEYMLVSPEEWEHRKQRVGTYRYDHQLWREESRDPWSVRGNKIGGMWAGGTMWVRIPLVVQVCRKVTGKFQAYEIYVPLPPDGDKGTILQLNSMSKLEDLCYNVGNMAMFMHEADPQGVDSVKKWHDDPKSRMTDPKEAAERLLAYVDSRGDEQPDVDVYGAATEAAAREQEEKRRRQAERVQVRAVEQGSAFDMAHMELAPEEEPASVSAPTLSGAAQAASHPNVTHLTDTLVCMGYLEDLQKGVFLLTDPLGTEHMGRRNRIAKHIKSKADAEEAMLVLCREGKMDLVVDGLFRVPHFEGEEEPTGQARVSSGSLDHQPLKKKPKSGQAKCNGWTS